MRRALFIYIPVAVVAVCAAAVSVLTRFNAMFYLAGLLVIAIPLAFGFPLVRASKEEFRVRAAKFPRWMFRAPAVGSTAELALFAFWRLLGWSALLFAAFGVCFLVWSATHGGK